jgi:hypothetical protein
MGGLLCERAGHALQKGNATLLRRSPCLVKAARLTGSTASQTAGVTTPPPAGRNWEVYRRQRDIAIRIVQSLTSKRMAIRPARDRPGHALAEMQRERSRAASTMMRLLKVRLSESAEQRGGREN